MPPLLASSFQVCNRFTRLRCSDTHVCYESWAVALAFSDGECPSKWQRGANRGKGKSGGYRIITYFAAEDVPILMLAVIDKGERADLTKAEQNELRAELSGVAEDYRESVRRAVARRRGLT